MLIRTNSGSGDAAGNGVTYGSDGAGAGDFLE